MTALPATPAAAAGCTPAELVPVLRLTEVNQGLPVYRRPLVYGKDTLVKLSLSAPACATSKQTLSLRAGSQLAVSTVVSGTATSSDLVATVMSGGSIVASSQAPSPDSSGDPIFTVPGTALAPTPATGPAFRAVFTPTVNYTANDNGVTRNGAITFPAFTEQFDDQQNALRVLVVPMGDFSSSTVQFTTPTTNGGGANAQSSVQAAFQSVLSRLLPLSSGVASLSSPPPLSGVAPGLRYTINGGLLDLGRGPNGLGLMNMTGVANEKFCGGADNFSKVQKALNNILRTYNATNPAFVANRVLGVIDETVSAGSSDIRGCFEGQAELGGTAGWSRAFWQSTSPDWTGPLAAMELGHMLGMTRPDTNSTPDDCVTFTGDREFHSRNVAADLCAPGRAYSTATASRLPNSRTFSQLSDSSWTGPNVLMEPLDYEFGQCLLGGSSTICLGYPITPGFVPGQQAARFTITGSIQEHGPTSASAHVDDSYVSSPESTHETDHIPAAGSRFVLAYVGAGFTTSEGLLLAEEHSTHGDHGGEATGRSFTSSRPLPSGTERVELRDTAVTPPAVLYQRRVEPNQAPVIVDTAQFAADDDLVEATAPAPVTATGDQHETVPALSGTGLAAWQSGAGLVLVKLSSPGSVAAVVDGSREATNPDFSRDGSRIVYERGGNIYMRTINADGTLADNTAVVVYEPAVSVPAHHPSFSPDAVRVVIEYSGDLYAIDVEKNSLSNPLGCALPGRVLLESCTQLTSSGVDGSPTWEAADSSGSIAFTRRGDIYRLKIDALTGQPSVPEVLVGAPEGATVGDPSYADGLLAYTSGGNVFVHSVAAGRSQQLTKRKADVRPSLFRSSNGAQLLFQRAMLDLSTAKTQQDIWTMSLLPNADSTANTYSITVEDPDGDPADLRAEFLRSCPDGNGGWTRQEVLGAAVYPEHINDRYARFRIAANPLAIPSLGCTGGVVRTRASDGAAVSEWSETGDITPGDPTPVVAISAPTAHAQVQPGRTVVLLGTGYGADNEVLPESGYTWRVWGTDGSGIGQSFTGRARVELSLPPGAYEAELTVQDGERSSSTSSPFSVQPGSRPVPVISSPAPDTTAVAGSPVDVTGSATDAEDGLLPASALDWEVTAPDGTLNRVVHGSSAFTLVPTVPGTWTIGLSATDTHGDTAGTSRTLTVVAPTETVDVNFSPTSLQAPPLPSDPDWVTVKVRKSGLDLSQVDPATVRITRIGSYTSANDPTFPTLVAGCLATTSTCSAANGWRVSGSTPDLAGTAQFDRKTLATYLASKGLVNQYVQIVVTGHAPNYSFAGYDPASPIVKG